jgi:putative FmdB family regulatory protein
MPLYEFQCSDCGRVMAHRRRFEHMDAPGPLCSCGTSEPTKRIFSPTRNLFVPIAFGYTWSDFHDVTETELARTRPDLEPAHRVASRPSGEAAVKKQRRESLEKAFVEAVAMTDAKFGAIDA